MTIFAVILNYKTPDMCLEAVQASIVSLQKTHTDWHICVVDNDSQDDSFEQLTRSVTEHQLSSPEWRQVSVVQSGRNGGYGAGNNFGIKRALSLSTDKKPDYIYILNSDAFPAEQALAKLKNTLDLDATIGIAGSYIHGVDGEPHLTSFRFPSIASEFEGAIHLGFVTKLFKNKVVPVPIPNQDIDVDWLAGASILVRREIFETVGMFDETFFLYFEETDLCRRVQKSGWRIRYVRGSEVAHVGSASTGMNTWQRIPSFWLDSRQYYFHKNHGVLYANVATVAKLVGGALFFIRKKLQGKTDDLPSQFYPDLMKHWLHKK